MAAVLSCECRRRGEEGEREEGLLRMCHMIKVAIGDSRIGRVLAEIRGE